MRSRNRALAATALALLVPALAPAAGSADVDRSKPWIVVDSGRAPDGSRYQHVLYGGKFDYTVDGRPISFRGWCKAFVWPGLIKGGPGGSCEGRGKPAYDSPIRGVDFRFVQYPQLGNQVAQPDVVVAGTTNSKTAAVKVFYTDAAGNERELPVDFARLDGVRLKASAAKLKRQAKRKLAIARDKAQGKAQGKGKRRAHRSGAGWVPEPFGVFTAFLPGSAGEARRIADLAESYYDDPHQPSPLVNGDLTTLQTDGNHCDDREGPFRIVAYDAAGRELPRPRYQGC